MNSFDLELLTPDKVLFSGKAESLTVVQSDGKVQILANHMSCVGSITAGKCVIGLPNDEKRVFISGEGILRISNGKTVVTSDLLEWEENLAEALEKREKHLKSEMERRKESYLEYRLGTVALERIFANLDKIGKLKS